MSFLECLKSAWKILRLVNDEEVISLSHAKVYVFSDSVLCLGSRDWFKDSPQCRTLDTIDGEPMEFEWNIFSGFTTLQIVHEVQKFMSKVGEPEQLTVPRTKYLHVDVQ